MIHTYQPHSMEDVHIPVHTSQNGGCPRYPYIPHCMEGVPVIAQITSTYV